MSALIGAPDPLTVGSRVRVTWPAKSASFAAGQYAGRVIETQWRVDGDGKRIRTVLVFRVKYDDGDTSWHEWGRENVVILRDAVWQL